jgi:hypothetical protein
MRPPDDVEGEMSDTQLDPFTADRLLSGPPAEDVPAGLEGVAGLLRVVAAGPTEGELAREAETVAAMSAALGSRVERGRRGRRSSRVSRVLKIQRIAAALVALLALGTVVAFAGSLPSAFQKVASGMLAKFGISVPNGQAGSHPNTNATTKPPEAALFGLCTAWQSGQGGENGKKGEATAFEQLAAAAGAAGKTGVQSFCGGVIAQHDASHPTSQGSSGQGNNGTTTADTKSKGRSDSGQSHRP